MKENNIRFDYGDFIKNCITFSDEHNIIELQAVLEIMQVDINTLDPDELIHADSLDMFTFEFLKEETVGNVTYMTSRTGELSIIIDRLLKLGISLPRLAVFLKYIDSLFVNTNVH